MSVFFTSDTHYNHKAVIKYCNRPFDSVEEMNEALIDNWNSMISKNDITYHLGDFCFGNVETIRAIRKRLNGTIHLIKGNHDYKWSKQAYGVFDSIENLRQIQVDGRTIVLCHFPIERWNKAHYGAWHLAGHSHGKLPFNPNINRLDVGVDCHDYKPVSFEYIRDIFNNEEVKTSFKYSIKY